jgi:alpha-tubulin suppressor-like RCC1 family protein
LWTWGVNYGGVGGAATAFSSPVQIGIGNTWLQMSASYQHSAAINAAGGLWVTGVNSDGRLGLNDTTTRDTLNFIPGSNRWVFVACGQTNTYAISTSGALFAWGTNTQGQLGNNVAGSGIGASSPVQVTTSALPWKFIAGAPNRWMGIRSDGSLWGCGYNLSASLGEGNAFGAYSSPVQVAAGLNPKWKYVALGDTGSFATSGAIKTDGSLWMWGSQWFGTVGNGIQSITAITTPIQIGSETTWKSLSLYFSSALAVKTDGTLWGWGTNEYRHLADNLTSAGRSSPIQIIGSYNSSYEDWLDVKFAGGSGTVIGIKRENILPNFTYDVNKN